MTSTAAGRTEGPWRLIIEDRRPDEPCIVGAGHTEDYPQFVATCHGGLCDREVVQHVNAAFIVRAVNSHEALVSALEDCRKFLSDLTAPDAKASGPNIIASYGNALTLGSKVSAALGSAREVQP